jgi:hypothetical protein
MRGLQGSHWFKEYGKCRAPIFSQNTGNAGFSLAQRSGKCRAPIGTQNAENAELLLAYRLREVLGAHWHTECGVCRAPIGLQSAESPGLPLAHRMQGVQGSAAVCMEPKRNLIIKINMKNLCFHHTSVNAILLVSFIQDTLL